MGMFGCRFPEVRRHPPTHQRRCESLYPKSESWQTKGRWKVLADISLQTHRRRVHHLGSALLRHVRMAHASPETFVNDGVNTEL